MRLAALALFAAACSGSPHGGATTEDPEGSDEPEDSDSGTDGSEGTEGSDAPIDPADPFDEADFEAVLLLPAAHTVAEANNAFAFDLLGVVGPEDDGNLAFSPFSLFSLFSMVHAGAGGDTAAELAAALHLDPLAAPTWDADYGGVMAALLAEDPHGACSMGMANALFGQQDFSFEATFLAVCEEDYGAPLQELDFAGDPGGSRDVINDWVETQTGGLVQDLVPVDAVTHDTVLALANAVVFNGSWLWAFDPEQTADTSFTRFDGTSVTVPTLTQEMDIPWGAHDGAYLVRLPYGCGDLSMILVLPTGHDDEDIRDIEARMDADWLADATDHWQVAEGGTLAIPRFSLDEELNVVAAMRDLGVQALWTSGEADLSGISDNDLYGSAAQHRAVVSIDEAGTVAAASSAFQGSFDTATPLTDFIADEPFLFLIRDEAAGVVLFMGRVADPS